MCYTVPGGTIDVAGGNFTLGTYATVTNSGTLSVAEGRTLSVTGGTFNQVGTGLTGGTLSFSSATIDVTGQWFLEAPATLNLNTISVTGTGELVNRSTINAYNVVFDVDLTNEGTLLFYNSQGNQINGAFYNAEGGTLRLRSNTDNTSYRYAYLTIDQGFTNAGLIEATNQYTYNYYDTYDRLWVTNGVLLNAPTGVIEHISPGKHDAFRIYASVDNQGTINVSRDVAVAKTGGTFTSSGTVNVSGGRTLTLSEVAVTDLVGGTLSGGSYNLDGTWKFDGAAITTNAAAIVLSGTGARIIDELNADALALLAANAADGSFTIQNGRNLATAADFANAGQVTVGDSSVLTVNGDYTQTAGATHLAGGTLTVAIDASLVSETGSVTGWVWRNTVDNSAPLTVSLASSDTGEATVPATVVIPQDAVQVQFTITGVDDGVGDGNQTVTITASAAGFNDGVTDATGKWYERVYLSSDTMHDGGDALLGTYEFDGTLSPGQTYGRNVTLTCPYVPGAYYLIVTVDATDAIEEAVEENNTAPAAAATEVSPAYRATVSAEAGQAAAGTPVAMHGLATTTDTHLPAAYKIVTVRVLHAGSRRVLTPAEIAALSGYLSPAAMLSAESGWAVPMAAWEEDMSLEEFGEAMVQAGRIRAACESGDVSYGSELISAEQQAARLSSPKSAEEPDQSSCAHVRLQLDQSAVSTRKIFAATLGMTNNSPTTALENISVLLDIRDGEGAPADDKFIILVPELTGFVLTDTGMLPDDWDPLMDAPIFPTGQLWQLDASSSGLARWVIIPTDEAATEGPTWYTVGGLFSYRINDGDVTKVFTPTSILVMPNAKLDVDYFWQRDVYSDDPFTEEIEPSVPFSLGVMVTNNGAGAAYNFVLESAQPQIIENVKGLLIDFEIIAAAAGNDYAVYASEGLSELAASDYVAAVGSVWDSDAGSATWSSGARDYTSGADRIVSFSQRSAGLDLVAPGADILNLCSCSGLAVKSGTSMAAPMVAAASVLVRQAADQAGVALTPQEILDALLQGAVQVFDGDDEDDNVLNTQRAYARLDVNASLNLLSTAGASAQSAQLPVYITAVQQKLKQAIRWFDSGNIRPTRGGPRPFRFERDLRQLLREHCTPAEARQVRLIMLRGWRSIRRAHWLARRSPATAPRPLSALKSALESSRGIDRDHLDWLWFPDLLA